MASFYVREEFIVSVEIPWSNKSAGDEFPIIALFGPPVKKKEALSPFPFQGERKELYTAEGNFAFVRSLWMPQVSHRHHLQNDETGCPESGKQNNLPVSK